MKISDRVKCAAPHPGGSSVVRSVRLFSQVPVKHVSFNSMIVCGLPASPHDIVHKSMQVKLISRALTDAANQRFSDKLPRKSPVRKVRAGLVSISPTLVVEKHVLDGLAKILVDI